MIVAEPVAAHAVGREQKPWVLQPARSKDIGLRPDRQFLLPGPRTSRDSTSPPLPARTISRTVACSRRVSASRTRSRLALIEAIELSVQRPMADDEFVPGSRCKAVSANLLRREFTSSSLQVAAYQGFDVLQPERPAGMRHPASSLRNRWHVQLSRSPAPDGRCPAEETHPRMLQLVIGLADVETRIEGCRALSRIQAAAFSRTTRRPPADHRRPSSYSGGSSPRRSAISASIRSGDAWRRSISTTVRLTRFSDGHHGSPIRPYQSDPR